MFTMCIRMVFSNTYYENSAYSLEYALKCFCVFVVLPTNQVMRVRMNTHYFHVATRQSYTVKANVFQASYNTHSLG